MNDRLYKFNWNFIGDVSLGRPNLGGTTEVEIYRLFQYTLRDVLEEAYGTTQADRLLFKAGMLAGKEFFTRYLAPCASINDFIAKAQNALLEKSIGILRIEQADTASMRFTLTVTEDLDCSGLPEMSHGVCTYDEGFLSGLFESFTGTPFRATEIDCWCTGDRVCRFEVVPAVQDT